VLWALAGMAAVGAAVLGYAALIERNLYTIRRHTIACLPAGAPPRTVLHVSDLHLRSVQRRKQRFLASLAAERPDLIVGTGDFLGDANPASVTAVVDALAAIGAPGIGVLGSNDYYSPHPGNPLRYFRKHRGPKTPKAPEENNPWRDLVAGLERIGWEVLFNETTATQGAEVLGLDDAHIGRADFSAASARARDGFRLAVAHSPDGVEALGPLGYDLIVAGHTHGGQVCLPWFGALVTNSHLPRRMARGVHRYGGTWLHVCGGLGTSMYAPVRFACRPEVCVLTLVPVRP
jgi:uncharacterized protein